MDYEHYSDQQLVDRILNNDHRVIVFFFYEKCAKMIDYIIANVYDGNAAHDELTNELYLYLAHNDWKKLRQFDFRSRLTTWVSVVAIRFLQKKREQLIEKTSSETLIQKQRRETGSSLTVDEQLDLKNALRAMPNKRYRMVIEQLDLLEASPANLAKEMNITTDNLYNIHRRAIAQLRFIVGRKEDYYG